MAQPFVRRIEGIQDIEKQEIVYSENADLLIDEEGNIYIISKDKKGLPIPKKERITYQIEVEDLLSRPFAYVTGDDTNNMLKFSSDKNFNTQAKNFLTVQLPTATSFNKGVQLLSRMDGKSINVNELQSLLYEGEGITINRDNYKKNIISVSEEFLNKFDELKESILMDYITPIQNMLDSHTSQLHVLDDKVTGIDNRVTDLENK